jgi:hypothetical protein
VHISRIHFKDGRAADLGAAIRKDNGTLTLESCIFSGNRTTAAAAQGGAIYNATGNLMVRGCTFYDNTTGSNSGGAIRSGGGTVTISGNLFFGSTSTSGLAVANAVSNGFNVVDRAFGTAAGTAGWTAVTGDVQFNGIGFANNTTLPFTNNSTSGADAFVPLGTGTLRTHVPASAGATMPAVDFYGNARTWPGAPGAVR